MIKKVGHFTIDLWLQSNKRRHIEAQEHLHRFLAVGSPEIVAAFADNFDRASVDQLKEVARRIDDARKAREQ